MILLTAVVFVAGVLGAAFAPGFGFLAGMRLVIGLAVGSASMVVPLYIGELAPPRYRGALVSFNQLAITSGILISFLVDYWLAGSQAWRLMFGLAAIPAVLLFAGTLTRPESPHWLVTQGRDGDARRILGRYRHSDDDVDAEIAEVKALSARKATMSELLRPRVRRLVAIGSCSPCSSR